VPDGAPPGAALDEYPFARSWAAYLKAIRTDGPDRATIANAWTERRGSDGGFLVPWTLTEKVFAYLTEAVIWPRASVLTMGEYRVGLPTLDNPSQANGTQGLGGIQFDLTPDGGTITTSNPKFGAQFLEAQKLAALISPVPNELAEDAAGAFDDLFSRVVGMGLSWELDDLFFNGSGVGEPQGILNASAALEVTRVNTGDAPVHADVIALLKKLHPASKKSATWLASEDVFDSLVDEYLAVGTPTTQAVAPPMALVFDAARGCWTLFGVDIEISDHQAPAGTAGDLCLADLGLYQIGSREMMTVDVSSQGSTFVTDASAYRIRTRVDGRFLPQSTYTLANGKVVSPLVVLS
jgi:HK97 family phage major capsid protein